MANIQDWMKSYRQDCGFDKLSAAGCLQGNTDIHFIANRMRLDLGLDDTWYETCKNAGGRAALKSTGFALYLLDLVVK